MCAYSFIGHLYWVSVIAVFTRQHLIFLLILLILMVRDISNIKLPQIMRFVEEGLATSFLSGQNYEFCLVDEITGKKY